MLAIMNIGKYASSYEPSGDVVLDILYQNVLGLKLNRIAYDGDSTIIGSEGITKSLAVSKNNGSTWSTITLSYEINRIQYIEEHKKFYALEALAKHGQYETEEDLILHMGYSLDGISWTWIEIFNYSTTNELTLASGGFYNITDTGFETTVLRIMGRNINAFKVTIDNNVKLTEELINTKTIGSSGFVSNVYASSRYTDESSTIGLKISSTSYVFVYGIWGVEDAAYLYGGTSSIDTRDLISRSGFFVDTYYNSSTGKRDFLYSYTGRNNSFSRIENEKENSLSFFKLGKMYYAYTNSKVSKSQSIINAITNSDFGTIGDLNNIINAFPLDDERVLFTSDMGTIYVCSVI